MEHFCIALVLSLTSASTFAAPAAYVESISGDLSVPVTHIPFDLGVNTVSGAGGSGDSDSFTFTVPAGMQLTAGSVTGTSPDAFEVGWSVLDSTLTFSDTLRALHNWGFTDALKPASLPGPAGTYSVGQYYTGGFGTLNYTFSFTVAPVPEPTGVALLAIGSLTLLARRAR